MCLVADSSPACAVRHSANGPRVPWCKGHQVSTTTTVTSYPWDAPFPLLILAPSLLSLSFLCFPLSSSTLPLLLPLSSSTLPPPFPPPSFFFHSSSSLSSSHRLTPASEATHSVNQLHLLLDGCSAQPSDYLKKLCRCTCTHSIQHSWPNLLAGVQQFSDISKAEP